MWLRLKALKFTQLTQEVERLRAARALYAQRHEETRIAEAIDQEELVNIENRRTASATVAPRG